MINSYYVNKKIFEKNYPDLSFIDKQYIIIEDFTKLFVNVKIYNTTKLERKLKLDKLNNKNTLLANFIEFVKSNDVTLTDVIQQFAQLEQNRIKYNSIVNYYNSDEYQKDFNKINNDFFIPNNIYFKI